MSDRRPLLAISQGCTRLCLLVGPYAIKLPNVLRGWRNVLWGILHNLTEADLSASAKAEPGWPELCPVLFRLPGGLANVMPRVRTLTDEEFAEVYWSLFAPGVERRAPVQEHPSSFGWLDGRLVAVDYAP